MNLQRPPSVVLTQLVRASQPLLFGVALSCAASDEMPGERAAAPRGPAQEARAWQPGAKFAVDQAWPLEPPKPTKRSLNKPGPGDYGGYGGPSDYGGYGGPSDYGGYGGPSDYGGYGGPATGAGGASEASTSASGSGGQWPDLPPAEPCAEPDPDHPATTGSITDLGCAAFPYYINDHGVVVVDSTIFAGTGTSTTLLIDHDTVTPMPLQHPQAEFFDQPALGLTEDGKILTYAFNGFYDQHGNYNLPETYALFDGTTYTAYVPIFTEYENNPPVAVVSGKDYFVSVNELGSVLVYHPRIDEYHSCWNPWYMPSTGMAVIESTGARTEFTDPAGDITTPGSSTSMLDRGCEYPGGIPCIGQVDGPRGTWGTFSTTFKGDLQDRTGLRLTRSGSFVSQRAAFDYIGCSPIFTPHGPVVYSGGSAAPVNLPTGNIIANNDDGTLFVSDGVDVDGDGQVDATCPALYKNGQITYLPTLSGVGYALGYVSGAPYYPALNLSGPIKAGREAWLNDQGDAVGVVCEEASPDAVPNPRDEARPFAVRCKDRFLKGVLWRDGHVVALDDLVSDASGWSNLTPTAMNNRGEVIGMGTFEGAEHGFKLATRHPLIVLPGFAGSELRTQGGTLVWPALISAGDKALSLYPPDHAPELFATDAVRHLPALPNVPVVGSVGNLHDFYGPLLEYLETEGHYVPYEIDDDPERLKLSGCDVAGQGMNDPTLFVFPYDWRKSNLENAAKLDHYVECVRQFHPDATVDLLAHSNGGLLARAYLLYKHRKGEDPHVNSVVSMGTPFLGTPAGIVPLETGKLKMSAGFSVRDFLLAFALDATTVQYVAGSFPALGELLPSDHYYDGCLRRPFVEADRDLNYNNIPYEQFAWNPAVTVISTRIWGRNDPDDPDNAGSALQPLPGATPPLLSFYNTALHGRAGAGDDAQDDWSTNLPVNTGVKYRHIIGLQDADATLIQLRATTDLGFKHIGNGVYVPVTDAPAFDTKFGAGDGTVPIFSALRIRSVGETVDLNAPGAITHVMTPDGLGPSATEDDVEHTGMLLSEEVQRRVLAFLRGKKDIAKPAPVSSKLPCAIEGDPDRIAGAPGAGDADGAGGAGGSGNQRASINGPKGSHEEPATKEMVYLTIDGGDHYTLDEPGAARFLTAGERRAVILVPTNQRATLSFQASGEVLNLTLTRGTGESASRAVRYRDLPVQPGAKLRFAVRPGAIDDLGVDADGDGVFEATVGPTHDLEGDAANDLRPPRLSAALVPFEGGSRVAVNATDEETGVESVWLCLTRERCEPYKEPVAVGPEARRVWAVALDHAGNRTALVPLDLSTAAPFEGEGCACAIGRRDEAPRPWFPLLGAPAITALWARRRRRRAG